MNDQEIAEILRDARTIAVVGLSDKPWRASHGVARYLQQSGYRILPVNPTIDEALGEKSYPSLADLPEKPDVVNVFRRPEHVAELVEPAIASGAKLFWMQLDVEDAASATKLREAGVAVVEDRCLMIERERLMRQPAQGR